MSQTTAETTAEPTVKTTAPAKKEYPYYLIEPCETDRVKHFLEAFAAILAHSNYKPLLDQYISSSTKCSRCTATCPVYQVTGDPRDIPCNRSNLLLKTYRRHFTMAGWLKAKFTGDPGLTEGDIDEMMDLLYRCTACRRCKIECPMGIDHGLMTHLGRWILSELGLVPKGLEVATIEQLHGDTGNTSGIPSHTLVDTLEFLEEEVEEALGKKLKYPVDEMDREYVFFPAVSDYLMEPETLMGNLAVIHAAGDDENWTIGTGYFDGINYGLFYSDHVLERVVRKMTDEVKRLRGKKILIGECGHASRVAKDFIPVFSSQDAVPVVNILQYTYEKLLAGKIVIDPNVITERVTYHDPCNIARSGWIIDEPRKLLQSFCRDFVDMAPNGRMNYCCGGGGGTVSVDEIHEFRMEIGGRKKAEQIRETGAKYVVAPCANCKKQISELIEHHGIDAKCVGLHDLILKAIRIPGAIQPGSNGGNGNPAGD
ncbi:MAG: (Fe-S)-binding protein [Planctomycetota bacterium]